MIPATACAGYQQLHLPVLILDLQGRITSMNPAAERLTGQQSEDLIGQPLTSILDPGSHTKAGLMLERVLQDDRVDGWELDHTQHGGAPILLAYSASLLRDESGEPAAVVALGRDLSEQLDLTSRLAESNQRLEGALLKLEKAHTELRAAQAQLVHSEKMRALGQMVAGVAHEINNPAAYVANNLSYMEGLVPVLLDLHAYYGGLEVYADEETRARIAQAKFVLGGEHFWQDLPDLIKDSLHGIQRISEIVASLRRFSRQDHKEMVDADVNDGLQATVRIIKTLADTRFEIREAYSDLPSIRCRPGELNQVFLNLLTNAVQAVEPSGCIWVSSSLNQDHIEVTIRDDGCGMDAATLARLGEPFFTTRPVGSGTGLGLAVSFGIIERHSGKLKFASQPRKGTTAVVELPLEMSRELIIDG